MNRAALGEARNVQRRLMMYAQVVPQMKPTAFDTTGGNPKPNCRIVVSPKSRMPEITPLMTNRRIWVFSETSVEASASSTGSSIGVGACRVLKSSCRDLWSCPSSEVASCTLPP
ncbi:Uncharacterised protein [Mycobacteroides abscessus subsp. abscessus]|nr:Uncharacterised protein [Mycobacteroides abscessus subsp. abscessus]